MSLICSTPLLLAASISITSGLEEIAISVHDVHSKQGSPVSSINIMAV